jgi:hypothetical protein
MNPETIRAALIANMQSIVGAVRVAPWVIPPLSGAPEDHVSYVEILDRTFGQLVNRNSLHPQAAPAARDAKL